MASFLEPPALLTLAVLLAGAAGAMYYGLRPVLKGPLPAVTPEGDEVWGVEDPPPPPKRRYVYPADRPAEAAPVPPDVTDREPEPLAIMAPGPTVAPEVRQPPKGSRFRSDQRETAQERLDEEDLDEEEEVSLSDLFRPKRRSHAAPNDAPTQD